MAILSGLSCELFGSQIKLTYTRTQKHSPKCQYPPPPISFDQLNHTQSQRVLFKGYKQRKNMQGENKRQGRKLRKEEMLRAPKKKFLQKDNKQKRMRSLDCSIIQLTLRRYSTRFVLHCPEC